MTIDVNLLPEAYIQSRRRERWFQRGATVGVAVVLAELLVGGLLYLRAADKHALQEETQRVRQTAEDLQQELADATRQAGAVNRNLELARALRASHCWSRLLAALSRAVPRDVVLTGLATDPPQWSPMRRVAASAGAKSTKAESKTKEAPAPEPSVKGVVMRGMAADHEGLSMLVAALQASGLFSSVDLQGMQREQLDGQEAVSFELHGRW